MAISKSYVEGDKNNLLGKLLTDAEPRSTVHEAQRMAIVVRCTEDLEGAIGQLRESADANAAASTRLGTHVFWLNVVLTAATVAMAAAAVGSISQ